MRLEHTFVPLGFAWSSPFARWQGPLAEVNSIDLAVEVTKKALKERGLPSEEITNFVLGWTVPQKEIFYGAPTVAARIGAVGVTGPMISQACATSVACLQAAAANHEANATDGGVTLVVTTDRTSNGPLVTYPFPSGPGGSPQVENWVLDIFAKDPWAGAAMYTTGENVATRWSVSREDQDAYALRSQQRWAEAAEAARFDDELVPAGDLERDEHPRPGTTLEKLATLGPAFRSDGTVTAGNA